MACPSSFLAKAARKKAMQSTKGGRALKFYASVRMDVRKVDTIKRNNCVIGNHVKVKIVKNKVAPPFSTAEMDIFYGKGICHTGEVLDFAEVQNIIRKVSR